MSRVPTIALALAVVALVVADGRASGTIDTTNATIVAGAAPTQGAVVIDADATPAAAPTPPSLGTLGTIGSMPGALAAFPGAGAGGPALHVTAYTPLDGGVYDFDSLTIDASKVIVPLGPVTLRVKGDVNLNGNILTGVAGASVTIYCGGDFIAQGGIQTATDAPIVVDVAGRFSVDAAPGSGAILQFTNAGAGIELIGRGGVAASAMQISHCYFAGGHVGIRSATSLTILDSSAYCNGATLQAFGGDLRLDRGQIGSGAGAVTVHASGAVTSVGGTFYSNGADCELVGFGGSVTLEDGYLYAYGAGANTRVRAKTSLTLKDSETLLVNEGTGTVEATAFGGDAVWDAADGTGAYSNVYHNGSGPMLVTASGSVRFTNNSRVQSTTGDVTIRALGGDVQIAGLQDFQIGTGALDIGASGDVLAGAAGGDVRFGGGSVRVFGDDVDLGARQVDAASGPVTLFARGSLTAKGHVTGATGVAATAVGGNVTLDAARIVTADNVGAKSGDVVIESYAGFTSGSISAPNADIRSGAHATASGDVRLRIVAQPRPTTTSYLLPDSVTVKLGAAKSAGLKASGSIGSPVEWLTKASPSPQHFVLEVGGRTVMGDLVAKSKGAVFEHKSAGVLFRVTPSKTGTSEATFTLQITGDLTGQVALDGPLAFRLVVAGLDARGVAKLVGGKFALTKNGGAVDALLFPISVAAAVPGGHKDTMTVVLGYSSDGTVPATAPAVSFSLGDAYSIVVPAAAFKRVGQRDVATKPASAPGISQIVVDHAKATVTVKGTKLDLGAFAATPRVAARIGLAFGSDIRSVDVVLARNKTKLAY